jgi:hypothetical protein
MIDLVKMENTVTVIHGFKGDGKTTACTLFLALEKLRNPHRKVYANYKLFFESSFLNGRDMIENREIFANAIIGLDEIHEYADSRDSGTPQNKRVCDFFLQSRHFGALIYGTDQYKDQYDKRIRRIVDYDIVTTNLFIDSDQDGDDDIFRITILNRRRPDLRPVTRDLYMKPVFDLFDSSDRINPFLYTKEQEKAWRYKIAGIPQKTRKKIQKEAPRTVA